MYKVLKFNNFTEVKQIYKNLSLNALPYWSYESISYKMNSFIYRIKYPKVSWFVVYDNDIPVMIAPLYIHIKKRLARVLGDVGYNICDFQYIVSDIVIIRDSIRSLLLYLKNIIFKGENFDLKWWYLSDSQNTYSALFELNRENFINIDILEKVKNTSISIGNNYDLYFQSLSKHVRQNVRTAYNRIHKDGFDIKFNVYEDYFGNENYSKKVLNVFKQYMNVYVNRQNSRYKNGIRKIIKGLLIKYFNWDFGSAFYSFSFLADVTINDRIAAMVKCYKDYSSRTLIIPMLAIDEGMYRYSPGVLLCNELAKYVASSSCLDNISLGRGNEKYKYDMGGKNYFTYKMLIHVK